MTWSAAQYTAFEDDRTRPVRDLVAAIPPGPVRSAVDLGCGPGNSTEVLAARFPGATVAGIDTSEDMLAAARTRMPGTAFTLAAVESWTPDAPVDVLLSNAVLQWVPGHATVLPRLIGLLAPGGSLAVQMPDNLDEPAYVAMRAQAAAPSWATKLSGAGGFRAPQTNAADYYAMLKPLCRRVDTWTTTYHHVLPTGADGVVEWFKGSGLRPFLAPLDDADRVAFIAEYRARIAAAYPEQPDGSVLLPFPRLFFVATT